MRDLKAYRHGYWRSLEHKAQSYDQEADSWKEFPEGAKERPPVPAESLSRRRFFGVMGASAALAGATATTGCIRKPKEQILPFSERPEDLIPGKPVYYSSAFAELGTVSGVLVESQDGRPTKIEGNPRHSGSQGAASTFAQASVLELYDPDRTRAPLRGDEVVDWATVKDGVGQLLAGFDDEQSKGQGLAVVLPQLLSPTQRYQVALLRERFPKAQLFVDDPMMPANAIAAAEMVGGAGARSFHSLSETAVVFAADSNFLGGETDHVRLTREWAKTRRVEQTTDAMSRLYVVEPHLSNTGVMADHRMRVKSSQVGDVMIALAKALEGQEVSWPATAQGVVAQLPEVTLEEGLQTFVNALAKDLAANKGKSAVLVGERQPAWVHALGSLVNAGLGNNGAGQRWLFDRESVAMTPVAKLAEADVQAVLCLGTNPAYDTPKALGLADKLAGLQTIHFGLYRDETAQIAKWHIPVSHWLEAWGDLQALDGTVSIQQPLIAPLHDTWSMTEWLGFVASGSMLDGYSVVKYGYAERLGGGFSDKVWRRWVHDGIVSGIPREPVLPVLDWKGLPEAIAKGRGAVDGVEVDFHLCPKVADGRLSNSGWMQELPHPITKLTWDNAAFVSAATASSLGIKDGDLLTLTVGGRSVKIPAFVAPGQAESTVSVSLGYGRTWGSVGKDVGVDVYELIGADDEGRLTWFAEGTLASAGGTHELVTTQDYGRLKPPVLMGMEYPERPIVLESTREEWGQDPNFVEKANLMPKERLHHLWDPPKMTGKQQWGMSVDLNTCTGCNACVVACQSENNIPVVGKKQVGNGREMHWMRIDRYFKGDEDNPTAVVQPMMCQHCEAAPCETVCPVAATVHSPEGLNDMAYNRCIGTRYCSNNCPFKVRRYNFFNYNIELRPGEFWNDDADGARLRQLQKNPDVTVRFRGVMEKCTYCVQRINQAKIEAHVAGKDVVEDGVIVTACQQTCPAGAIVFGDIANPDSAISRAKANDRDYQVLRDLNIGPRTSYLARIRNPNPELV
ncbi:MAG: Fe-S-cluster-containing hydrogenase [Nannocystaceae bacterium]